MDNMIIFRVLTIMIIILPFVGIGVDVYLKRTNHRYSKGYGYVLGRCCSFLVAAVLFFILPFQLTYTIGEFTNFISRSALVLAGVIFVFIAFSHIFLLNEPLKYLAYAVIVALFFSGLSLTITNTVFDFQDPRIMLGTVENRINTYLSRGPIRYHVDVSVDNPDGRLRTRVTRRFYNSVQEDDMVYVCIRPGRWGFEWVSCIHRVIEIDGQLQVYPGDDAKHLHALQ